MRKLLEYIRPPDSLDPPDKVIRWMQGSTVIGVIVIAFICWALGFGAAVGLGVFGAGFARADALSQLATGVTCSAKYAEIERKRSEIYQVKREIEMAGPNAREIDRQRLEELTNTVRDDERRYTAIGCDKVN